MKEVKSEQEKEKFPKEKNEFSIAHPQLPHDSIVWFFDKNPISVMGSTSIALGETHGIR